MVRNLTSIVSGREVVNQFVITTKKGTFFQSYSSIVAKVDNKGQVWLSSYWNYSKTTLKYLYQFLREQGYSDLSSKKVRAYINDKTFKYKDRLTM